jgi:putative colanic acid biosynthesis acetyltransferase WcaF
MTNHNLIPDKIGFVGPSFRLMNRVRRLFWQISWIIFAIWTPPFFHKWRIFLLRVFGAEVSWKAYIYSNVKIWAPWNLTVADFGTLGPGVVCYNIAPIFIGIKAVVSQGAELCTGTHDYRHPTFPLVAKPISIGRRAWVCANALIGPGVSVGEGAVLGAAGVAFYNLESWTIYIGNPATLVQQRPFIED